MNDHNDDGVSSSHIETASKNRSSQGGARAIADPYCNSREKDSPSGQMTGCQQLGRTYEQNSKINPIVGLDGDLRTKSVCQPVTVVKKGGKKPPQDPSSCISLNTVEHGDNRCEKRKKNTKITDKVR